MYDTIMDICLVKIIQSMKHVAQEMFATWKVCEFKVQTIRVQEIFG